MKISKVLLWVCSCVLMSCHIGVDSSFYKDGSASMEIFLKLDQKLMENLKKQGRDPKPGKGIAPGQANKWLSVYEIAKAKNDTLPIGSDSLEFMKSTFVKYEVKDSLFVGIRMKIERASTKNLKRFNAYFRSSNPGKGMSKDNENFLGPREVEWDGKKLVIYTDSDKVKKEYTPKESSTDTPKPENNSIAESIHKMFNGVNIIVQHTFRFENKIKEIKGDNILFTKLDDYTYEFKFDMNELEEKAKAKLVEGKLDSKIIVVTE